MAISSNKSSFPISSKTHSDSKTTESSSNTLIRKSFNGNPLTKPSIVANSRSFNPVTPANSPAEFSRKILGSKEGFSTLRGSNEYKENEKDQKRLKEGFVSKGTKSFMAPTISAISKISPSPRKKVLTDRNETVRSSIADSEEKSLMDEYLSELTEDIGSQVLSEPQNHSFKPRVIKFEEPKTDSIASSISESLIIAATPLIPSSNLLEIKVIEETSLKSEVIHKPPASPCPVVASLDSDPLFPHYDVSSSSKVKTPSSPIAPLDSDPHLPPYDPKTNYLSPRPRFLHYKPKPRVEVCLNEKNESDSSEGRKLEDSFTSESCSDTEKTEETQSSGSIKESEDGCNSELISEEDKVETHVTETELEYAQLKEDLKISNSSSFVRSKIGPLLMVFLIACVFIPVIDTPVLLPSGYKGQPYKVDGSAKLAEFAKANIDELALNVKLWSAKTFSYVSTLISTPREAVELHPLYFSNLTVSNEEPLLNDDYQFKESVSIEREDVFDQIDLEYEMWGGSEEMQNEEELEIEEYIEFEEQPPLIHAATEVEAENVQGFKFHEQDNIDFHTNPEHINQVTLEDAQSKVTLEVAESKVTLEGAESDASSPTQSPEMDVLPPKFQLDPVEGSELDVIAQSADIDTSTQILEQDVPYQSTENAAYIPENLSSVQYVVGIVSAVLTIVATAAYVYQKQKKVTTLVVGDQVQQLLPKKMASRSISGSGDSEHEERISYRPTQVEMVGESGPSEMSSSFKRSLSFGPRGSERVSEVRSHEKRQRHSKREHLAASDYSAGSPSYGSFTTYEKIHSKHGCGEEEVVTPVRRSSRIRNITSP